MLILKSGRFYVKNNPLPDVSSGLFDLDINSAAAAITVSLTSSVPTVCRKSSRKLAIKGILSLPGRFGFLQPNICSL